MASFAAIASENFIRFVVGGVCEQIKSIEWSTDNLNQIEDSLNDFAWDLNTTNDQYSTERYKRDIVRELGLQTIKTALYRR